MSTTINSPIDFQALVDGVGDGIMAADAQGLITLWNPACERMFGFAEVDALGKSLDLIIPQRQQKPHWEGYDKTMATGITKYGYDVLRVPAMHKDGHTLSIAFTVSMLHNPDGSVSAIVAVIRDESVKFAQERALKKRITELEMELAAK